LKQVKFLLLSIRNRIFVFLSVLSEDVGRRKEEIELMSICFELPLGSSVICFCLGSKYYIDLGDGSLMAGSSFYGERAK
jgi:hypothetical protein